MQFTTKLLSVSAVLGAAFVAALPFRKAISPASSTPEQSFPPMERRLPPGSAESWGGKFQHADKPQPRRVPTAATGVVGESSAARPEMPPSYHRAFSPVGALIRPAEDDEPVLFDANATITRTHKIADGDTLSSLAERYLGNAARYLEIYECNREALKNPDLLPIGLVINLPNPQQAASAASTQQNTSEPSKPIVPIPRGAFGSKIN